MLSPDPSGADVGSSIDIAQLHAFDTDWSGFMDRFMRGRSVLNASLFPEKPTQMAFGYCYAWRSLTLIAAWIGERMQAEQFGESQSRLLAPATRLHFSSSLFSFNMGLMGELLAGRSN